MALDQITTHVADAIARLLEQYKGKPLIAGVVTANATQTQDVDDVVFAMILARSIFTGIGAQLDQIGVIVDLARPVDESDDIYRILLFGKIGVNTSQGKIEQAIIMYAQVLSATHVDYYELFPAAFAIMANGDLPDPSLVDIVFHFLEDIAAAGVRVDYFGHYDATDPFTFDGGFGGGFGDSTTPATGGKFASLYIPSIPHFAFAGDDSDRDVAGFGDRNDPVTGGRFVSA